MIEIEAACRFGDFSIDVAFTAPTEGIVALFGKSGSGKTSLVNLLAGLARPSRGRIVVNGVVLFDSAAGIDLPPERRRLGYVFQEGRLFPHLNVQRNLIYGQRRTPGGERHVDFDRIVGLLGIAGLLHRRPAELSGGEKQRVAIGRALLASPRLLLMDEPLASLDTARKDEILPFIEQLRDELRLPIVYVSHDSGELLRLADTVVLMSEGRAVAVGPLEEIMSRLDLRPLTGRYEAGAVLRAKVSAHDPDSALTLLDFPGGTLYVARLDLPLGTEIRVRLRARDVAIALTRPADISILNVFPGVIAEIGAGDGPHVDLKLDVGVPLWARVTRRSARNLELTVGREVFALVKAVAIDRHSLGQHRAAPHDEAEIL